MSGQTGTLGKYQIIREIARSNDIVYEAYDPVMNRRVALKELALPTGSTEQLREDRRNRFLREARAAGTLTHPNIVTIYEYGEESGRQFIAMEFLEGHTLRNEIDTRGFLSPDQAIRTCIEVLEALEFAHGHGVIHRDIKPDNIQLLPDGRVKITDFGIARLTFEPNLTMDGQVFGTPSYMSPEQVVGKEIDARSDLFSVAVLLYEMVAGKKPFGGDSVVSITYSIMNTRPDQPSQVNWALWQVIERGMEKSPQLRYGSAEEMKGALDAVVASASNPVLDPNPAYGYPQAPAPLSGSQPIAAPPPNNPYLSNPYLNPYGAPPPPIPNSAPGTYTYDPFASGNTVPPGYPMNPPASSGTYLPPPVYYPPAPRAPLLKPETRQFLGKLLLAMLILGTFFGLVIALVTGLSTAFQREASKQQDSSVQQALDQALSLSTDDAIAKYEQEIPNLKDSVNRTVARAQLAVLYERKGKVAMRLRDYVGAESWYKRASELDNGNAAYLSDLGELYSLLAGQEPNASQRLTQRIAAAEQWSAAHSLETMDQNRRQIYRSGAFKAQIELANESELQGSYEQMRGALQRALDLSDPDSDEARMIRQRLEG